MRPATMITKRGVRRIAPNVHRPGREPTRLTRSELRVRGKRTFCQVSRTTKDVVDAVSRAAGGHGPGRERLRRGGRRSCGSNGAPSPHQDRRAAARAPRPAARGTPWSLHARVLATAGARLLAELLLD